jgi:hypothetical protein
MSYSSIVKPVAFSQANQAVRYSVENNLFPSSSPKLSSAPLLQSAVWNALPSEVQEKQLITTKTSPGGQKTHSFVSSNSESKVLGLWTTNEDAPEATQQRRFKLFLLDGSPGVLSKALDWSKAFSTLASQIMSKAPYSHQSAENLRVLMNEINYGFSQHSCSLGIPRRISIGFSPNVENEKDQSIHISRFLIGTKPFRNTNYLVMSELGLTSVRMQQKFIRKEGDTSTSIFKMSEDFPQILGTDELPQGEEIKLHERHLITEQNIRNLQSGSQDSIAIGFSEPLPTVEVPFFFNGISKQAGLGIPTDQLDTIQTGIEQFNESMIGLLKDIYKALRVISPEMPT